MAQVEQILTELDNRRLGLKMSCRALADLSGVNLRTVQRLLREHAGAANLSTVLALAEALGAKVRVVTTRQPSAVLRKRAMQKARKIVSMAQGSAALEMQGVGRETRRATEQEIAAKLLAGSPIRLWEE